MWHLKFNYCNKLVFKRNIFLLHFCEILIFHYIFISNTIELNYIIPFYISNSWDSFSIDLLNIDKTLSNRSSNLAHSNFYYYYNMSVDSQKVMP